MTERPFLHCPFRCASNSIMTSHCSSHPIHFAAEPTERQTTERLSTVITPGHRYTKSFCQITITQKSSTHRCQQQQQHHQHPLHQPFQYNKITIITTTTTKITTIVVVNLPSSNPISSDCSSSSHVLPCSPTSKSPVTSHTSTMNHDNSHKSCGSTSYRAHC